MSWVGDGTSDAGSRTLGDTGEDAGRLGDTDGDAKGDDGDDSDEDCEFVLTGTRARVGSRMRAESESPRELANIQTVSLPVRGTLGCARAMAGSRELTGTQTLAETLEIV